MELLHKERDIILSDLTEIKAGFANLENRFGKLIESDSELRTMVKLDPMDPESREFGTGGGEEIPAAMSDEYYAEQDLLMDVSPLLDRFLKLAELQKSSYEAIYKGVLEKKEWMRFYPGAYPLRGTNTKIQSGFGLRDDPWDENIPENHEGIDLAGMPIGTPIYATADGVISVVEKNPSVNGFGLYVKIDHNAQKFGWLTLYGHLSEIESHIKKGYSIKRGEKLGELGNTGRSTAPHLHYGIQYYDMETGRKFWIDPRKAHFNPAAYKKATIR
jgi:murein DD-endopeptidase MepM/ murein hydrolase activator NlpD